MAYSTQASLNAFSITCSVTSGTHVRDLENTLARCTKFQAGETVRPICADNPHPACRQRTLRNAGLIGEHYWGERAFAAGPRRF